MQRAEEEEFQVAFQDFLQGFVHIFLLDHLLCFGAWKLCLLSYVVDRC